MNFDDKWNDIVSSVLPWTVDKFGAFFTWKSFPNFCLTRCNDLNGRKKKYIEKNVTFVISATRNKGIFFSKSKLISNKNKNQWKQSESCLSISFKHQI